MKNKLIITVSVIVIILVGIFITLSFFPTIFINSGKIDSLQEHINKKYEGLEFNLNAKNFKASYSSGLFNKTHYKLKLRDASVRVGVDFLKKYIPEDILAEYSNINNQSDILLSVAKVNLIYGPFDNYLAVRDLRGIRVISYNNDLEVDGIAHGEISRLKTNIINLSALLKNNYDSLKDAYLDILLDNPAYRIAVTDANIQLKSDYLLNNFITSKLEFKQETTEDIVKLMNNKTDKDVEEILKSGKEKQVSILTVKGANLSTVTDNSSFNYSLKNFTFSSSFQPQDTNFMTYKIALKLEGLETLAKGDDRTVNEYNIIDGLEMFNGSFAIENISPKLAKNYFNLIKYSRSDANAGGTNFQELASHLSALMASIKEAKPRILLDINPLKHKLLETYVDGDLAFTENSNIPLGVINIKSTSLDTLQNKLTEYNILNENSIKLFNTIKGYLQKSEGDFYVATIEIKNQIPYVYINGQPIAAGQMQTPMPENNQLPQTNEGVK